MVHAPAIKRLDAFKLWHNILQAGREQDLTGRHGTFIAYCRKFVLQGGYLLHTTSAQRDRPILLKFRPRDAIKFAGRCTFLAE
jgi:hypothetical protein